MSMLDQLFIGRRGTLDDFDASLKERAISAPEKKTIKKSVPFSNATYDFSAINGEVYWDERELNYVFEIIAETPEEMERKKTAFSNFVMNVMNEEIHDPYEPAWHYVGTFDGIDFDDDESMEKTTVSVVFAAYPYKVANNLTVFHYNVAAGEALSATVINDSSHRITPTLIADASVTIQKGSTTYTLEAGETQDEKFMLESGVNMLTITNANSDACTVSIEFYEEVF